MTGQPFLPGPGYRSVPTREWRASDCPAPTPEVLDRLRRLLPPVPLADTAPYADRAA